MDVGETVRRALADSGWFPGRSVEPRGAEAALRAAGYFQWPGLSELLREYDGLTIKFERNGRADTAVLDAVQACSGSFPATVRSYEERLDVRLVPIGFAYHDHLLLTASEDGRFFGGYDDTLIELGSSPIELVESLVSESWRPPPQAPK